MTNTAVLARPTETVQYRRRDERIQAEARDNVDNDDYAAMLRQAAAMS